jgi:5-formyltetrahydrofolate cyclo-ligase
MLAKRDTLSPSAILDHSKAVTSKLLALDEIVQAQNIFVYVSFRSEVSTLDLIDRLLAAGKTVSVPVTKVATKRLDPVRITNRIEDLRPGYCSIPEPHPSLCKTQAVEMETIDTILLPGSVFDLRGGRLGYGGGYYDRFVEKIPEAIRIGLCFALQLIELAPLQPHDQLLDLIVTEKEVLHAKRGQDGASG